MIITGRRLLCIFTSLVAVCLLAVMAVSGRTKDPVLWIAVAALGIVTAALLSRRRAFDPFASTDELGDLPSGVQGTNIVTHRKIVLDINGERREYDSLDEVPPEHRAMIEKARQAKGVTSITITVNGERRTYSSLEEVPPEYRAMMEKMRRR